jgi:hypothetical protein
MSKSFYDLDYYIEINEKRDADLKAEYDKTLGRISNIIIIYSGFSVFLIAICKDFFNSPCNLVYLSCLVLFLISFIISFIYTVRFWFPNIIPALATPKDYYSDLRTNLEASLPSNPGFLTPAEQDAIDKQLKMAYILELEDAIEENTVLVTQKQADYFRAFSFAIFCILPFVACMFFHFLIPEEPMAVKIVNSEKNSTLVVDTVRVLNISLQNDSLPSKKTSFKHHKSRKQ